MKSPGCTALALARLAPPFWASVDVLGRLAFRLVVDPAAINRD
jgi:hypothetical protein